MNPLQRLTVAVLFVGMVACGGGSSSSPSLADAPTPSDPFSPVPTPVPAPSTGSTNKVNVFYSGHSLTDNPLPDNVALIAASLGTVNGWNQQVVLGSPIRMRVKGLDPHASGFPGYRLGKNRGIGAENMDVVSELRSPRTLGANQRYDALVLTENHNLPMDPTWGENTIRYARHIHERLIEGNASATTYIYHAWQSFKNIQDPSDWIAYERAAAPVWQCIAQRLNTTLAHEGRGDRVQYIPAGPALAQLVERAVQGGVDGITSSSVAATMRNVFTDDVHLSSLGAYYMALVTYASLYKSSPMGAAYPAEVTAAQARSLQNVAWQAVSGHVNQPTLPALSSCAPYMAQRFCSVLMPYINQPSQVEYCRSVYSKQSDENPFWFNAATDRNLWLPAP